MVAMVAGVEGVITGKAAERAVIDRLLSGVGRGDPGIGSEGLGAAMLMLSKKES